MAQGQSYVDSDAPYRSENHGARKASLRFMRMSVEDTLDTFEVASLQKGLTSSQATHARKRYGANQLAGKEKPPIYRKWIDQLREPLNLLLLGSAGVSVIVGQVDDAVCITVALMIVITVGIVQEYRSEKSLEALNQLVPPKCHLQRDGEAVSLFASELVPGDVVTFSSGDRIPADLRIAEASSLELDESTLTGEGHPVQKTSKTLQADNYSDTDDVPINERQDIAFMGTLVQHGTGKGIVIATGADTEFGSIFDMVDQVGDRQTPMQRSMADLAQKLSIISLGIIAVIMLIGALQQQGLLEMFTIAVSLAVAAIPEGLPIVVTVTLALGALRMSRQNAIMKNLPSVETLGCMSVICSDKTGTLTKNEMRTVNIFTVPNGILDVPEHSSGQDKVPHAVSRCLEAGMLCNNSETGKDGELVGQSTETAMIRVLSKYGMHDRRKEWTRQHETPFRSDAKMMDVTGHYENQRQSPQIFLKGAPEVVLKQCAMYETNSSPQNLNESVRREVKDAISKLANNGLRVLAMASAQASSSHQRPMYVFSGLQAMQDPPREGVKQAIEELHNGRVQIAMITGDSEVTASAIARQLGLTVGKNQVQALTGTEIEQMSDRQLREKVLSVSVFARTAPEHKLRIVSAFQSHNQVVGMTGDGVNDAPSLKLADVGVAMGKGGTDVTKEAADMILVDDNFATILSAVREGKSIFYNIQNFVGFQLSTSAAALILIGASTLFRLRFPLNPMQILFINILMDGPPSQSLGVDPPSETVMQRPPRSKDAPVVTRQLLYRTLFSAVVIVAFTQFVFLFERQSDGQSDTRGATMTFTCFVLLDLVSVVQNRGLLTGIAQNTMLLWTVGASLSAQLLIVYLPPLQKVFQTEALALNDLTFLLVLAACAFGLHEARRSYERGMSQPDNDKSQASLYVA
ncbi:P-type Ca(2+) transporter [Malassezia yamatoensis]|uniref:Calcium-transporting ATPase n=1 Tax=Malassezia yamatoensis TaxID=253288 RepID=A0AAJ5YT11_9BASI|nr:P-type Ca(2+) transporter [Malassezia yamatoensis]